MTPTPRAGGSALFAALVCTVFLSACYATSYPRSEDGDESATPGDGDGDGGGGDSGSPPIPGAGVAGGQPTPGTGGQGGQGGAAGTGGRSGGGAGGAFGTGGITGTGGTIGGGGGEFDCRHGCPDGQFGSVGCCTSGTDVPAHAAITTGQCGLELGQINPELDGLCIERNQPGTPDRTCPVLDTQGLQFPGCCTSTGICGNQVDILELGCATVNVTIQPCGQ